MVEAKMEREETSTSDIGLEISIEFRQELALAAHLVVLQQFSELCEVILQCNLVYGMCTVDKWLNKRVKVFSSVVFNKRV